MSGEEQTDGQIQTTAHTCKVRERVNISDWFILKKIFLITDKFKRFLKYIVTIQLGNSVPTNT